MNRLTHWPELLAGFIEVRRHSPFEWGKNDCALFAADAVLAITGTDLAEPWRGQYADELAAVRFIKEFGGMRGLADSVGLQVRRGYPHRGDVVMIEIEGRISFGVLTANRHVAGPGEKGLVFRTLDDMIDAFVI